MSRLVRACLRLSHAQWHSFVYAANANKGVPLILVYPGSRRGVQLFGVF